MNLANMRQRLQRLLATRDGRAHWHFLDSSSLPVKQALLVLQEEMPAGMTEGQFMQQHARRLSMKKRELREWIEIGLIALGWQRGRKARQRKPAKYTISLAILCAETGIECGCHKQAIVVARFRPWTERTWQKRAFRLKKRQHRGRGKEPLL